MKRKRLLSVALGVAVGAAIAGGIVWAAIPAGVVINGCYQKSEGNLRVLDSATAACRPSELPISWNQAGLQGAQGPKGDRGDTGARGSQGEPGPQGAKGADGAAGPTGAKGDKGDPGNLALAGRSCAEGAFVTGFDQKGDLVCVAPGGGGGGGGGEPSGIVVSPPQLDFPSIPVAGVSEPAFVTLTNPGPVDVTVSITFTGDNLIDFVADGCLTVPAQGTCVVSMRFSPTGPGVRRALMTIQGPNGQIVLVPLSGTGVLDAVGLQGLPTVDNQRRKS
jgi:hypothetical protein